MDLKFCLFLFVYVTRLPLCAHLGKMPYITYPDQHGSVVFGSSKARIALLVPNLRPRSIDGLDRSFKVSEGSVCSVFIPEAFIEYFSPSRVVNVSLSDGSSLWQWDLCYTGEQFPANIQLRSISDGCSLADI